MHKTLLRVALVAALFSPLSVLLPNVAFADTVVYNAVPATLAPNYPSQPFQAQQTSEFGDYVHLGGTDRHLTTITVTMDNWALQATPANVTFCAANASNCDATGYNWPITVNVYSNHLGANGAPDTLLATKTVTQHIPWRPAEDPTNCPTKSDPGYAYEYKASDGNCYNGLAANVSFDLSSLNVTLPNDVIVGFVYNTQTYGPSPAGVDGPYNSLNIAVPPTDPVTVGTDDSADKVFWNTSTVSYYTNTSCLGNTLCEDTNWTPNGTVAMQINVATPTNATIVITPSNMQGWAFVDDTTNGAGTGMMVTGPSTPPLGTGSAQLTATSTTDGQILAVASSTYAGVKLSSLTALSYATYQDGANPSTATAIALQFDVDQDVTAVTHPYQGRIVFEPYLNNGGSVTLGSWNTWNALSGKWWLSHSSTQFSNNCSQASPCTFAQLIALYPNIGIFTDGVVDLKAGSGWTSFKGNADDLTIGINNANTTYDFEPAAVVAPSPSVTTNAATLVSATGATLNGTNGPVAADNSSFWVGPTSAAPASFTSATDPSSQLPAGWTHDSGLGAQLAGASFSSPVTGLTSNTGYSFVAWVQVGGTWYPDSILQFTTTAAPVVTVVTNSATAETGTTATLHGTNGSTPADNTSFWWGTSAPGTLTPMADPTSELPSGWSHDSGLGPVAANGTFSGPITGLTASTTYNFVAWVQVGGIWYPASNVLKFITPTTLAVCPAGTTQGTSYDSFSVDSASTAATNGTQALANGKSYLVTVSGSWQNGSTNAADAGFSSVDSWASYMEGYDTTPYFLGPQEFQTQVNGAFVNWGPYSPAHTYSLLYTGNGSPISMGVFDGDSNSGTANSDWYSDNSGSLAVNIYPCVSNNSSLTITKSAIGGDGTFNFTSTIPGHSSFSIPTTNHTGSVTFDNVAPGTYTVTEVNQPSGWTQTENNCSTITTPDAVNCVVTDTKNTKLGSIRGSKFEDWDGDSSPFETRWEDGLKGWTIYLDTNNNNQLDPGEPTAITDKNGLYVFTGLVAGTYTVREVQQPGWTQTYPSTSAASDEYSVSLSAGQNAKKKDFGNFKMGTISGMKYNDLNGDGKKESNEPSLSHITINLKGPHGFASTTVTDANGNYAFGPLGPGVYTLSEVVPSGWRQTQHPGTVKIVSGTAATKENFGDTQKPAPKAPSFGNHH